MADIGPESDTKVGDVVTIQVPADGPYGVIFEAGADGCAAVVKAWERLPNGKFGACQKHGGIHYGDVLIAVCDTQTDILPFNETMALARDRNILKKSFTFISGAEHYRRK